MRVLRNMSLKLPSYLVDISYVWASNRVNMRKNCGILAIVIAWLGSGALGAAINFPTLTANGGSYLSGVESLSTDYQSLANVFSKYAGEPASFVNHLYAPIGRDNLGKFPAFYFGVGTGVAIGRGTNFKDEAGTKVSSSIPSTAIADAALLVFNFGVGISRQWDLRFSFFPNAPINLPSIGGGIGNLQIKEGRYKARLGYHIWEGGTWKPGLTLAGFLVYSDSTISASIDGLSYSDSNSSRTISTSNTSLTMNLTSQSIGMGPEIKLWYEVWHVFHPFLGYSLGLQAGHYTTGLTLASTVSITPTGLLAISETGTVTISERVATKVISHRLMFGFEIALLVLNIGIEGQVDLVNGLIGAGVGVGFRF